MQAQFLHDIARNRNNAAILARWPLLDLPDAWLVAGCLFQTVWNLQSQQPAESGIKDYDLFYFDPIDRSATSEREVQARVSAVLADLGIEVEVANQARVHLWYEAHFKRPYPALVSAEDGVRRFLVLETCVGVRPGQCLAPYGLGGVYAGRLSPNPITPYPELFDSKVQSYRQRWPHLQRAG